MIGQNNSVEQLRDQREVASLLIPLADQLLLVPNVTVAEIVPIAPIQPVTGMPEWYLGDFVWREQRLPLVSFEAINGGARPGIDSRGRIAVLNTTGIDYDLPFIALLTQGIPRLARVTEEEIVQREDAFNGEYTLMPVSWAGEDALIPDVSALERACLNSRAQ